MEYYSLYYKCSNCFSWTCLYVPKMHKAPFCIKCYNCRLNTSKKSERIPEPSWIAQIRKYDSKTKTVSIYE